MYLFNQYKKYLILGTAITLLILFVVWYLSESNNVKPFNTLVSEINTTSTSTTINNEKNNKIYVDVKGAVKNPGVYEFLDDARIIDAIEKAGGLTKNAVTSNINLSQKLKNEMVIYIFTKNELTTKAINITNNNEVTTKTINSTSKNEVTTKIEIPNIITTTEKCQCETIEVNNCLTKDELNTTETITTKTISSSEESPNTNDTKININTATAEELTKLSGIGLAKADAIVNYRKNNGNFKTIEDIKNVSGLGETLFEKIKDSITV